MVMSMDEADAPGPTEDAEAPPGAWGELATPPWPTSPPEPAPPHRPRTPSPSGDMPAVVVYDSDWARPSSVLPLVADGLKWLAGCFLVLALLNDFAPFLAYGFVISLWAAAMMQPRLNRWRVANPARKSISSGSLPAPFNQHLARAAMETATLKEAVDSLGGSTIPERLQAQVGDLDRALWRMAVAGQSTHGLVRAEAAARAAKRPELVQAIRLRLDQLDQQFAGQVERIASAYRAVKSIEALMELSSPEIAEVLTFDSTIAPLGSADMYLGEFEAQVGAIHDALDGMEQGVRPIGQPLELDIGGGEGER